MNTTAITETDVAAYLLNVCDAAVKKTGATHAALSFSTDTQFRDTQTHFAHLRFGKCNVCGSGNTVSEAFADAASRAETPEKLLEEKRRALKTAQDELAAAEVIMAEHE